MYSRETTIKNKTGLHARPATAFAQMAADFDCKVLIARADEPDYSVNAKSVALLLTLSLCSGDKAIVSADGEDAEEAVDALIKFIDAGLGE